MLLPTLGLLNIIKQPWYMNSIVKMRIHWLKSFDMDSTFHDWLLSAIMGTEPCNSRSVNQRAYIQYSAWIFLFLPHMMCAKNNSNCVWEGLKFQFFPKEASYTSLYWESSRPTLNPFQEDEDLKRLATQTTPGSPKVTH